MEATAIPADELALIQDPAAETLVLDVEISDERAETEEPGTGAEATQGQSSAVKIYRVSCASGASAQFTIPITAYYWHARLGYYRSDGSRIGFSQIVEWPRSLYGSGCKPTGAHTGKPAPTGLVVSETSDDDDAGLGVHCSLADVLETPACAEIARR